MTKDDSLPTHPPTPEQCVVTKLTDDAARTILEDTLWPRGPVCPHCGTVGAWAINGADTRPGLYKCKTYKCRRQFTVTSGTPLIGTLVPLSKVVNGIRIYIASEGKTPATDMGRVLGTTYRTARLLKRRIKLMKLTESQRDRLWSLA